MSRSSISEEDDEPVMNVTLDGEEPPEWQWQRAPLLDRYCPCTALRPGSYLVSACRCKLYGESPCSSGSGQLRWQREELCNGH